MTRDNKGYSLVELMVVVTLIAIMAVAIVGLFTSSLRTGGAASATAKIKEEGDYAISTLERLIRQGADASCAADSKSLEVLELADAATPAVKTNYHLTGVGALEITNDKTPPESRILTSSDIKIDNLVFVCTGGSINRGDLVSISFRIAATGDLSRYEDFSTKVVLRNISP